MLAVKQIDPGSEGTVVQTLSGIPSWVPTDSGYLVTQTFTSASSPYATVIDTAVITDFASGLPLNSNFRVGLYTVVRDTTDDFRIDQNSQIWVRTAAGAPVQSGIDQGPQAMFSAALADVVGTQIVASGTGLLCQYGGSVSGIHLAGTMKLYLQVISTPSAL